MNPARTRQLLELYKRACALAPEERVSFLRDACTDPSVIAEVEAMLREEDQENAALSELALSQRRAQLNHLMSEALLSADDPFVPEQIGPYRVVRLIGEGATGLVYEAVQHQPERRVALKVLRPGRLDEERLRRFRQEVEALGRLHHAGIAVVHEGGALELPRGLQPYLAMELVEGCDLLRFASQGRLSLRERVALLARVSDAVAHAHERHVIHRDLKPENILVTSDGQPKVLDFGVARIVEAEDDGAAPHTASGELLGTLAYMSPEQLAGEPVTAAADVYALGVLAYELLCGRPPLRFGEVALGEAIEHARTADPPRLGLLDSRLRGDLEWIVAKSLEKSPRRRYPDAGALAEDLRRYLEDRPISARPPSAFYRMRKHVRRHRGLAGVTVGAFTVLVTILLLVLHSRERERQISEQLKQQFYRSAIGAANYALNLNDLTSARAHLSSVPDVDRGWEWHHVHSTLESWLFDYELPAAPVGSPAVTSDGHIAVAQEDGTVALWRAKERHPAHVVPAGSLLTTLARHQPPGRLIAGTSDGGVLSWDLETGQCIRWETGMEGPVQRLDCASDGTIAAYVAFSVLLRRPGDTLRPLAELKKVLQPDLALNPTATRLIVLTRHPEDRWGGRAQILLYDLETRALLHRKTLAGEPIALSFSPDGQRVAVGDRQRSVMILDAETLSLQVELLGHAGPVTSVAFSPDGGRVVSASDDGTLRVWDLDLAETARVFQHGWPSARVTWAADGDKVVAAARDGEGMRCWSLRASGPKVLRGHTAYVYSAAFSPDGSILASAGYRHFDPMLRLWDPLTGRPLGTVAVSSDKDWVAFSADGLRLVSGLEPIGHGDSVDWATSEVLPHPHPALPESESRLEEWKRRESCYRAQVGPGAPPQGAVETGYSRDGRLLARRAHPGLVEVRSKEDLTVLAELPGEGLQGYPDFSPDGQLLACASIENDVFVWEWRQTTQPTRLRGHTSQVYGVRFSPDGSRLASCGNDNRILLWNTTTFERTIELLGHTRYVFRVEWSPDGRMLASASGDATVRLWDSVPVAQRFEEARQAEERRAALRPALERLIRTLGGAGPALAALRGDASLSVRELIERARVLRELADHAEDLASGEVEEALEGAPASARTTEEDW